ncbi:uncharacterized protein SRS1_12428 [Sporisorium reilianum f. sp. reilianum]|uniref:Uncharacterized protein n=1 Tax=Sporisorium reilianum f. sp. reilianum TaxID=72559 RepID=A0A2N8U819_9BASI|nr:uncharacterized protein SRS1_12428 [Sporisorium reilianum f. sp. reilianum]
MMVPTSILAVAQLVLSALNPPASSSSLSTASSSASYLPHIQWSGELPQWPTNSGASVSACTFALGPPGPPASALCPAFNAFCASFRDDMRSRRIRTLKTHPPLTRTRTNDDDEDPDNPLKDVKFRSGCTGGAETASDGSYLSGYTATCIVDGVDWVPYVFDRFLRAEFSESGNDDAPLPIYASFIGCQVPAHV